MHTKEEKVQRNSQCPPPFLETIVNSDIIAASQYNCGNAGFIDAMA